MPVAINRSRVYSTGFSNGGIDTQGILTFFLLPSLNLFLNLPYVYMNRRCVDYLFNGVVLLGHCVLQRPSVCVRGCV